MGRLLFSKPARKFYVLALWGVVGAAVDAGFLPPGVRTFMDEHTMLLLLTAFGVGHVAPEAAK